MPASIILTEATPWKEWEGFGKDVSVKVLRDDEHCGAQTLLVKIPPGGELPLHSHRGVVQKFVIEGECTIDGSKMTAGAYALLPAHSDVPPVRSREGATMLLIYDPLKV
jgi:quercetin dioxygenase-like cupin family protein